MIGRIPYPLHMHTELQKPAVAAGVTWDAYVGALSQTISSPKESVSIGIFKRWCAVRAGNIQPSGVDERLIEDFAAALESGELCAASGKKYKRSILRQAATDVRILHNRIHGRSPAMCLRVLLPRLVARKLSRFARLTPQTRAALEWFEMFGAAPSNKNSHKLKPLTTATRVKAVYAVLSLLDQTDRNGLEEIHEDDLKELSQDDPTYRTQIRQRHSAATVFRCCVAKKLLTENPLIHTSSETFAKRARRDFISPDQLNRLLDLSTVDQSNRSQVMDRLVMLMFLDLALRKNELAAVQLGDVRELSPGKFQVTLDGDAQKMGDKPSAAMDVLYSQTAELLRTYIRLRGSHPGVLFLNGDGAAASGQVLYECVKRESQRLNIKTYFGAVPSCHSLRRSFATNNADRLGMKLNPHEIAQRLRCGIDVAYAHYVQENVLLRSMKADEQRKQLASDPLVEAEQYMAGLQKLGISGNALATARAEIEAKLAPKPVPENATWTTEAGALKRLSERWELEISWRILRPFFTKAGAIDYNGEHKSARYRDDVLNELLGRDPVEVYIGRKPGRRQRDAVTSEFDTIRIGWLALVRRDDGPRILKFVRARAEQELSSSPARAA